MLITLPKRPPSHLKDRAQRRGRKSDLRERGHNPLSISHNKNISVTPTHPRGVFRRIGTVCIF